VDYLAIVNKYLPDIMKTVKQQILDDEVILEFVNDKKELEKLLQIQEQLIVTYLQNFKLEEIDEGVCKQFYKDLKIPYTIIFRSLNLLKTEMLKALNKENIDRVDIYEFSIYFNSFADITAKVYLKKDIVELKKIFYSKFKDYLLFHSHIEWVDKIIKSIQNDNIDIFPIQTSNECNFSKYILYPESLMICMDKNLCNYLEKLHEMIHKLANSFYLFYRQERFSEAYFIFKDLKEHILKFKQLIGEFYFSTYSNLENSFFKLIELIEYQNSIYLTSVNIKSLKSLNNIYGETVVTSGLLKLEKRIKNFFNEDQDRTLVIKAVTSDFYMLNMNYTDEEFENILSKLEEIILEPIIVDDVKINFEVVISGIKIDKYSQIKEIEFIKILLNLQKEAKKQNLTVYSKIKQTKEFIDKILNEEYNEKFILKKLEEGAIDVEFQPIYNIENNDIYTLEVLGRIVDKNKFISAGVFIDKIYAMNKIETFDSFILDKLIEKENVIKEVTNRLFINISFPSLLNEEYMKKLQKLFKTFKIEIILELTEQKFVQNLDILKQIHDKYNINFAVDDFGTGYSSLKTVVELVKQNILKILKIDGTLVQNIEDDEYMKKIIKIISRLGEELELKTVAEFVENKKVLDLLKSYKVDLAQGYYLSKPKKIEELLALKLGVV